MSLLRRAFRAMGLPVHAGWRHTHPSGFDIQCKGCGERRSMYALRGHYGSRDPSWWETTKEGDGSCGPIKPLPARIY